MDKSLFIHLLSKSQENLSRVCLIVHQYCFLHFADCSFQKVSIFKIFSHINHCLSNATTQGSNYQGYSHNFVFGLSVQICRQTICIWLVFLIFQPQCSVVEGMSCCKSTFFFFALSSRVKPCLLAIVVLHRWNSKSHSSFPLFSNTISRSHRSLYQTISPPTSLYSFTQATAMIISAHDYQCSIMPRQVLAVCQDLASSSKMFNGFISFVTYSTVYILN